MLNVTCILGKNFTAAIWMKFKILTWPGMLQKNFSMWRKSYMNCFISRAPSTWVCHQSCPSLRWTAQRRRTDSFPIGQRCQPMNDTLASLIGTPGFWPVPSGVIGQHTFEILSFAFIFEVRFFVHSEEYFVAKWSSNFIHWSKFFKNVCFTWNFHVQYSILEGDILCMILWIMVSHRWSWMPLYI